MIKIKIVRKVIYFSIKIFLNNRHLNYIIKRKDMTHHHKVQLLLEGLKHNIKITIEESMDSLLKRSKTIIGFNSLTCVDSLLSYANIYVPYFMDAKLPDSFLQMSPHDMKDKVHGFSFVKSPQEFIDILEKESASPNMNHQYMEERKKLFSKYFTYDDEKTSTKLLENVISKFIGGKK